MQISSVLFRPTIISNRSRKSIWGRGRGGQKYMAEDYQHLLMKCWEVYVCVCVCMCRKIFGVTLRSTTDNNLLPLICSKTKDWYIFTKYFWFIVICSGSDIVQYRTCPELISGPLDCDCQDCYNLASYLPIFTNDLCFCFILHTAFSHTF